MLVLLGELVDLYSVAPEGLVYKIICMLCPEGTRGMECSLVPTLSGTRLDGMMIFWACA